MKLTKAEQTNCRLLAEDKSVKEVAAIRGVSPNTVRVQVESAKLKLGVNTQHGLTAKYIIGILVLISILTALFFNIKQQDTKPLSHVSLMTKTTLTL